MFKISTYLSIGYQYVATYKMIRFHSDRLMFIFTTITDISNFKSEKQYSYLKESNP